ncbi:hypothetical protein [Streptomyces sp. TE5632]
MTRAEGTAPPADHRLLLPEGWVPFPLSGTLDLDYWAKCQAKDLVERYERDGEKGNARLLTRDLTRTAADCRGGPVLEHPEDLHIVHRGVVGRARALGEPPRIAFGGRGRAAYG